jgi:hypothetical protein
MIKGEKILFLTPEFYNYPLLIRDTMISMGAKVDLVYNRPTSVLNKLYRFFSSDMYERAKEKYFRKLIKRTGSAYDQILIIRADLIPDQFFAELKNKYPDARFIQYIWDDIDLFPGITETFRYFDRIISYNIIDCQKYALVLRPFFFVRRHAPKPINEIRKNELFFIGAYHSDRLNVIKKVKALNPQIKLLTLFYINPITFLISRIPLKDLSYFNFKKMKYGAMLENIENSIAILDIQNISQQGLTTRVFEALGAGAKVITVNESIVKYDFYNKKNILIIDRDNPEIEKSWMSIPYEKYSDDFLHNYHISKWVTDVFDFTAGSIR